MYPSIAHLKYANFILIKFFHLGIIPSMRDEFLSHLRRESLNSFSYCALLYLNVIINAP